MQGMAAEMGERSVLKKEEGARLRALSRNGVLMAPRRRALTCTPTGAGGIAPNRQLICSAGMLVEANADRAVTRPPSCAQALCLHPKASARLDALPAPGHRQALGHGQQRSLGRAVGHLGAKACRGEHGQREGLTDGLRQVQRGGSAGRTCLARRQWSSSG